MFDVKKHLIKVQGGKQYLPVAARLIWFRTEHPDWGIETKPIAIDVEKQYAIFESSVYNADGKLMAKGTKMENLRGFGDWLEKAETGAIGRALAVCGYGTQFAPDLDEVQGDGAVDSPYPLNDFREDRGRYDSRSFNTGHSNNGPGYGGNKEGLALVDHRSPEHNGSPIEVSHSADEVPHICQSCNTSLKPGQITFSVRKFGHALCPDCQKKRKAV